MARPATNDPDIFDFGMAVQHEILIRRVLVLAHTALNQRSLSQRRKAQPNIGTGSCQPLRRDHTFHRSGVNDWATCVVSHLEATPVVSGNAVEQMFTMIDPNRKLCFSEMQVACPCTKEEHLLTSGNNHGSQKGEDFPQPGITGKNI